MDASVLAPAGDTRSFEHQIKVLWLALDKGASGFLSELEAFYLLEVCGVAMRDEVLGLFMQCWCVGEEHIDEASFIDAYEEFRKENLFDAYYGRIHLSAIASVLRGNAARAKVVRTWQDFDENGDGNLDADEIIPILISLGMPHEELDVRELFHEFGDHRFIAHHDFLSIFECNHPALRELSDFEANMRDARVVLAKRRKGHAQRRYCNQQQVTEDAAVERRTKHEKFVPVLWGYTVVTFTITLYSLFFALEVTPWLLTLYLLSDLIYIWWLWLQVFLPRNATGLAVVTGRKNLVNTLKHNLRYKYLWVDFLVALPLDFVGLIAAQGLGYSPLWRANKALLFWHLKDFADLSIEALNIRPIPARIGKGIYLLSLQGHAFGCVVKFTSDAVGERDTYSTFYVANFSEEPALTQYFQCLDYAVKTSTGWGRGDPIPRHDYQILQGIVLVFTGVCAYAFLLATIANALKMATQKSMFVDKLNDVKSFLGYSGYPDEIAESVTGYYKHMYRTTGATTLHVAVVDDLPFELMVCLKVVEANALLRKVPMFRQATKDEDFVFALSLKLSKKVLSPGETVTQKGEPGSCMYFITHGSCDILDDDGNIVFQFQVGNFFGEVALLHDVKRTATIKSHGFCNVLILTKTDFEEVTLLFPEVLDLIYGAAGDRLKKLEKEMLEDSGSTKQPAAPPAIAADPSPAKDADPLSASISRSARSKSVVEAPGRRPSAGGKRVSLHCDMDNVEFESNDVRREFTATQSCLSTVESEPARMFDLDSVDEEDDLMGMSVVTDRVIVPLEVRMQMSSSSDSTNSDLPPPLCQRVTSGLSRQSSQSSVQSVLSRQSSVRSLQSQGSARSLRSIPSLRRPGSVKSSVRSTSNRLANAARPRLKSRMTVTPSILDDNEEMHHSSGHGSSDRGNGQLGESLRLLLDNEEGQSPKAGDERSRNASPPRGNNPTPLMLTAERLDSPADRHRGQRQSRVRSFHSFNAENVDHALGGGSIGGSRPVVPTLPISPDRDSSGGRGSESETIKMLENSLSYRGSMLRAGADGHRASRASAVSRGSARRAAPLSARSSRSGTLSPTNKRVDKRPPTRPQAVPELLCPAVEVDGGEEGGFTPRQLLHNLKLNGGGVATPRQDPAPRSTTPETTNALSLASPVPEPGTTSNDCTPSREKSVSPTHEKDVADEAQHAVAAGSGGGQAAGGGGGLLAVTPLDLGAEKDKERPPPMPMPAPAPTTAVDDGINIASVSTIHMTQGADGTREPPPVQRTMTFGRSVKQRMGFGGSPADDAAEKAMKAVVNRRQSLHGERSFGGVVKVLWLLFDKKGIDALPYIECIYLLEVCGVEQTESGVEKFMAECMQREKIEGKPRTVGAAGGATAMISWISFHMAYEKYRQKGKFLHFFGRIHLAAIASVFKSNSKKERAMRTWRDFDVDGDGNLDKDEIVPILQSLGLPHEREDVEELFDEFRRDDNLECADFISIFSCDHPTLNQKTEFAYQMDLAREVLWKRSEMQRGGAVVYRDKTQLSLDVAYERRMRRDASVPFIFLHALACWWFATAALVFTEDYFGTTGREAWATLLLLLSDCVFLYWFSVRVFLPLDRSGTQVLKKAVLSWQQLTQTEHLVDFAIALPFDIIGLGVYGWGYSWWFRVNKVFLLYHIPMLFNKTATGKRSTPPQFARIAGAIFALAVIAHILACAFNVVQVEVGDQHAVTTTTIQSYSSLAAMAKYLQSYDYAVKTMSGLSRGRPIPSHDAQVAMNLVTVMTGVAVYAFVLATISNALQVRTGKTVYLEKIDEVDSFLSYSSLPPEIKDDAMGYYKHLYRTTGQVQMDVRMGGHMDDLPYELEVVLSVEKIQSMLQKVPIFADAARDGEFVYALSVKLRKRVLSPGETVTVKGEPGSNMYFITHGVCNIIAGGAVVFQLKVGNFFGEIALLHNTKRTATIEADEFCNVLVLEKVDFEEVCGIFPDALKRIQDAAADRLESIKKEEMEKKRYELRDLPPLPTITITDNSGALMEQHDHAPPAPAEPSAEEVAARKHTKTKMALLRKAMNRGKAVGGVLAALTAVAPSVNARVNNSVYVGDEENASAAAPEAGSPRTRGAAGFLSILQKKPFEAPPAGADAAAPGPSTGLVKKASFQQAARKINSLGRFGALGKVAAKPTEAPPEQDGQSIISKLAQVKSKSSHMLMEAQHKQQGAGSTPPGRPLGAAGSSVAGSGKQSLFSALKSLRVMSNMKGLTMAKSAESRRRHEEAMPPPPNAVPEPEHHGSEATASECGSPRFLSPDLGSPRRARPSSGGGPRALVPPAPPSPPHGTTASRLDDLLGAAQKAPEVQSEGTDDGSD